MILRDPVHGLVSFEAPELSIVPALLVAPELQRLRRIRQLGLTSFAYPGADHTRFSHAVGSAYVMTRFIQRLRAIHDELPYWQRVTTERAREAVAAALLHDIGHGPFSHLFEEALPHGPSHEAWTVRILTDSESGVNKILRDVDPSLPGRIVEFIQGRYPLTYLTYTVSGSFDVDRCDYLLRDAHATGVEYGTFDLDWLLRSLCFGKSDSEEAAPPLAIDGAKGLPAIESFIMARLFMFQQVYFHKASRASEWMLTRILERVSALIMDGTRVKAPAALQSLALTGDAEVKDYLELDDISLWSAIAEWRNSQDEILSDFCTRLYNRRLFKTLELLGPAHSQDEYRRILAVARDLAEQRGLSPDHYVGLDNAVDVPYDEGSAALRVVFPTGEPQLPGDVSFVLGRLRGEKLDRTRLIFPEEIRAELFAAVYQ